MSVLKLKDELGVWQDIPSIVGEAAGFGTVTATVDTNVGTPAVVVTSSGEDTAKNFAFQFKNLGYDDSDLQSDFSDLADDFDVLQGQFDTAVAAVTTDTEVTDIRVGADGVTDTTAGASVRRQFTDVKSATRNLANLNGVIIGKAWNGGANTARAIVDVPIQPSTTYAITISGISGFEGVYLYEKTSSAATTNLYSTTVVDGYTRQSNASANCLTIQFNKTAVSKSDFASVKLQVVLNTVPTPYIDNVSANDKVVRNEYITYVTPEMFGAWGDGTHDDTLALQAALDTGKNVIANKYYKITNSLSMTPVYTEGQKFEFNQIICSANKVALKLNGRNGFVNGLYLESNGTCVSFGETALTYNWHTHFSVLNSKGGNAVKMGGPDAVSEITVEGERFWYWTVGVWFDLGNYWVGQITFKNMTICTNNPNGEYAFLANGASHPLTGLSVFNVSLEGSRGGFNFVNTVAQYPVETLNCFGLRTSEMSIRDGFNVMRVTGSGIVRGVMVLDACMLSTFDFSNAPNMRECFIVMGRLMGESTDDIYGMAIGQPNNIKPIRLASLT